MSDTTSDAFGSTNGNWKAAGDAEYFYQNDIYERKEVALSFVEMWFVEVKTFTVLAHYCFQRW